MKTDGKWRNWMLSFRIYEDLTSTTTKIARKIMWLFNPYCHYYGTVLETLFINTAFSHCRFPRNCIDSHENSQHWPMIDNYDRKITEDNTRTTWLLHTTDRCLLWSQHPGATPGSRVNIKVNVNRGGIIRFTAFQQTICDGSTCIESALRVNWARPRTDGRQKLDFHILSKFTL